MLRDGTGYSKTYIAVGFTDMRLGIDSLALQTSSTPPLGKKIFTLYGKEFFTLWKKLLTMWWQNHLTTQPTSTS